MDDRRRRLGILAQMPRLSRMDHRHFLDDQGKDVRVESLPRKDRRRMKASGRKIGKIYVEILCSMAKSGAGYEADQLIRQLTIEYTNRYAASGVYNQPMSFNYFEPFCDIKFIEKTCAPYAMPAREINNLFGLSDFVDYLTDSDAPSLDQKALNALEEGVVYHYNIAGSVSDFTFLSPAGNEFVVASFSVVRRRGALHWYMIAGELLPDDQWDQEVAQGSVEPTEQEIYPAKALFLADVRKVMGSTPGAPLCLSGVENARKTIASGEIEIATMKHLGRCLSTEYENMFMSITDDPDTFDHIKDKYERLRRLYEMNESIGKASAVWALAESMLKLPQYFFHVLEIPKETAMAGRRRAPPLSPKSASGDGERFRYVPSIALVEHGQRAVRRLDAPYYELETEGFWRHIERDEFGRDRNGNLVQGKTWVSEKVDWRTRSEGERSIYIKSSIAQAKVKREEFLQAISRQAERGEPSVGVLYVMRCLAMREEVYKVGWTSGSADDRARELSTATGVPTAFAVVDTWQHEKPAALEAGVHARLAPYRLSDRREFFQVSDRVIREAVQQEIDRMAV